MEQTWKIDICRLIDKHGREAVRQAIEKILTEEKNEH